jgi:hypothetical protein
VSHAPHLREYEGVFGLQNDFKPRLVFNALRFTGASGSYGPAVEAHEARDIRNKRNHTKVAFLGREGGKVWCILAIKGRPGASSFNHRERQLEVGVATSESRNEGLGVGRVCRALGGERTKGFYAGR